MFLTDIFENFRDWVLERISPENRKMTILIAAGSLAILLLIITGISILAGRSAGENEISAAGSTAARPGLIPAEELFLPEEPDFLPGVMPDRERRTEWTAEDAAPFWKDPLKDGEEQWRNYIEKTVDEILENVP